MGEEALEISIHAPPRGATRKNVICLLTYTFQFTPLREGRREKRQSAEKTTYFNSRPSARGDMAEWQYVLPVWNFNSRPSARGDRHGSTMPCIVAHFNSRPSARGDGGLTTCGGMQYIFQFTPLREGRQDTAVLDTKQLLFQFTPLREGRRIVAGRSCTKPYFNSRPSARGDPKEGKEMSEFVISIHAPPRGATPSMGNDTHRHQFQFTPLREGRQGKV